VTDRVLVVSATAADESALDWPSMPEAFALALGEWLRHLV
jgi:hypothetical protein